MVKSFEDFDENHKSPTAVDFSDISECIDEEDGGDEVKCRPKFGILDTDYDDIDREIMPPPSSLPQSQGTVSVSSTSPTERKLETPLASMLPSKYAGVSVST